MSESLKRLQGEIDAALEEAKRGAPIQAVNDWFEVEHFFPMKKYTNEPDLLDWNNVSKGLYVPKFSESGAPDFTYGISLQDDDLCLDCDVKNYPPGRDMAKEWLNKYPSAPRTTKTPSGGYHFRYKKPADFKVKKDQKDWPGIEFRSKNLCVVGPGCYRDQIMKDGRHVIGFYRLVNGGPPVMLPDYVLETLEQATSAAQNGATTDGATAWSSDYEEQFKVFCQAQDPAAPDDPNGRTRGITAFKIAAKGRDLNLPPDETFVIMRDNWNTTNNPPLSDKELYEQVQHGYKYAKGTAGIETAEVQFKGLEPTIKVGETPDPIINPPTTSTPAVVKDQHDPDSDWPELVPLQQRELPPSDPFPMDALGTVLGNAAKAVQADIQAPDAIVGNSFLAAASLGAQGLADIEDDGRRSPLSLFILSIGVSGERKSSADTKACYPAYARQASLSRVAEDEQKIMPSLNMLTTQWLGR